MMVEHSLLNRNIKVKIGLTLQPLAFFLGLIDKVQCDLQMLCDPRTCLKNSNNPWNFYCYFLLLTLPKGALNKMLKKNIEMERYLYS